MKILVLITSRSNSRIRSTNAYVSPARVSKEKHQHGTENRARGGGGTTFLNHLFCQHQNSYTGMTLEHAEMGFSHLPKTSELTPWTSGGLVSQPFPKPHFSQCLNGRLAQGQKQVETVCTHIVLKGVGKNLKGISILWGQ